MNSAKKNILVVEDNDDSRHALCVMLETMGYSPLSCNSAKQALSTIVGKTVSLALLDIMMPEMNGYELLKQIRGISGFENLPVIMVTAKDEDSEIIEGYQFGADYYITKPFTAKQLEYGLKLFL